MKRRFDFRLRRLLRVRDIEENLARSEWAEREGVANAADEASEQAAEAVSQARADIVRGAESEGPISPAWLDAAHGAVDGLSALLRKKRETSASLRSQADAARDHWREIDARRRGLVELEARARIQHRIELERTDNTEMDEIASARSRILLGAKKAQTEKDCGWRPGTTDESD